MSQVNGYSSYGGGRMSTSGRGQSNKLSLVHDAAIAMKRKSTLELGAGVSQSGGDTTFIKLVQWYVHVKRHVLRRWSWLGLNNRPSNCLPEASQTC